MSGDLSFADYEGDRIAIEKTRAAKFDLEKGARCAYQRLHPGGPEILRFQIQAIEVTSGHVRRIVKDKEVGEPWVWGSPLAKEITKLQGTIFWCLYLGDWDFLTC